MGKDRLSLAVFHYQDLDDDICHCLFVQLFSPVDLLLSREEVVELDYWHGVFPHAGPMRLACPSSLDTFFAPLAVRNVVNLVFVYFFWTGHSRIRCDSFRRHVFRLAF